MSNGSPVAIGGVKLVAASATDLDNCKFWNDRGSRKAAQSDETAVTLEVGTTAKTVAELYFEATGENFHDRFGLEAIGMTADAPANEIDVYLSGNTDSVDYSAPTTKIFVCGQVPQEVWSYGAGVAGGSAGDPTLAELAHAEDSAHTSGDKGMMLLAIRKDSAGTLASADGDYAPLQVDSEGAFRGIVKGYGQPGVSAEQYPGFPAVGMARSSDRGALGPTEGGVFTMSLLAKLINLPYALPGLTWSAATAQITTTNETTLKAAGGAGIRHYLTSLAIVNTGGAVASGSHVTVLDGSGGTVLWAGQIDQAYTFPVPLRGSANTALIVKCSAAGDTRVSGAGYSAGE